MNKAFTMIEMIFAIVIIGILSAVGIAKIISNRDDAVAKVCEQGAGNLLYEVSGYYAKNGYWDKIEDMSSLPTLVDTTAGNGKNGIKEAAGTVLATNGVLTYVCNGEAVVTYTPKSREITDVNGIKHNNMGLLVENPGTATTVPAKIVATDFVLRDFFKADPGYVIGGN